MFLRLCIKRRRFQRKREERGNKRDKRKCCTKVALIHSIGKVLFIKSNKC